MGVEGLRTTVADSPVLFSFTVGTDSPATAWVEGRR